MSYFASLDFTTQLAIRNKRPQEHSYISYSLAMDGEPLCNDPFLCVTHLFSHENKYREWYIVIDYNQPKEMHISIKDENPNYPTVMKYIEEYLQQRVMGTSRLLVHTNLGIHEVCNMEKVVETTQRYLNYIHDIIIQPNVRIT